VSVCSHCAKEKWTGEKGERTKKKRSLIDDLHTIEPVKAGKKRKKKHSRKEEWKKRKTATTQ